MILFTTDTGPDGESFAYAPEDSGSAVRERLPRKLKRELYVAQLAGRLARGRFEHLLAWVYSLGQRAWYDGNPRHNQLRTDAQDVLRRFWRVSAEMRGSLKSRRLDRLLNEIERHFTRFAGKDGVSLAIDGALIVTKKGRVGRPTEQWKKIGKAGLRKIVNGKLADRIVTAIARDVARRENSQTI